MYIIKSGFPAIGELVFCEVKSLTTGGVFLELLEYKKEAFLPIPEISAGRIRNLRDFVEEGKRLVCVVLTVDEKKNEVVVSLRRVSESDKRRKLELIRQEMNSEELIKYVSKQINKDPEKLYVEIYNKIKDKYVTMYDFFTSVVDGEDNVEHYVSDKKIAEVLKSVITERIKPKFVEKKVTFNIKVYQSKGVELIRNAFEEIYSLDPKKNKYSKLNATYLGRGMYDVSVIATEFKDANKVVDEIVKIMSKYFENKKGIEYSYQVHKGDKL